MGGAGQHHLHPEPARHHNHAGERPYLAHDTLVCAAFSNLGYKVEQLTPPDNEALQFGKEFGNRAQCNPTYFTVGNLVKHLVHLRDKHGMATKDIVENYLFITAGACGPCRFGTYVTEYRKALRDAGFDGFRVMLFQQQGGLKQAGEELGLEVNQDFCLGIVKSLLAWRCTEPDELPTAPVRGSKRVRLTRPSPPVARSWWTPSRKARASSVGCGSAVGNWQGQGRPQPAQAPRQHHRRVLGDDHRGRRL